MAVIDSYVRSFDERVAAFLPDAARRVEALGMRLRSAGLSPGGRRDGAALDRLPVLSKDELIGVQAKAPPFGGLLAPEVTPRRLFQSPGPLYEPDLGGRDSWGWAPALRAAGPAAPLRARGADPGGAAGLRQGRDRQPRLRVRGARGAAPAGGPPRPG